MFDHKLAEKFMDHINKMSFEEIDARATAASSIGIEPIIDTPTLIFLDDERNIEDVTWIKYSEYDNKLIIRTYDEFINAVDCINDFNKVFFSFDHDIQDFNDDGSENTGYDCAKYLCDFILNNAIFLPAHIEINFVVHSKNPIGKANIESYINNFVKYINS